MASQTQGKSRMPQYGTSGSVRGAAREKAAPTAIAGPDSPQLQFDRYRELGTEDFTAFRLRNQQTTGDQVLSLRFSVLGLPGAVARVWDASALEAA